jgi:hypothetical protein
MTMTNRIEMNPKVMMGKPVIRGTRIPVELTHIIHDRFYCNRRYAAATSLAARFPQPSGQSRRSVGRHTVSNMPSFLAAPRAHLAWRLGCFVTNRHK